MGVSSNFWSFISFIAFQLTSQVKPMLVAMLLRKVLTFLLDSILVENFSKAEICWDWRATASSRTEAAFTNSSNLNLCREVRCGFEKKMLWCFSEMSERIWFFPVGLNGINAIILWPFLNLVQPLIFPLSCSSLTQTGMNASPERSLQPCCVLLWACQT